MAVDKMTLKTYLESSYQGGQAFLEHIVFPIFGEDNFKNEYETNLLDNHPEYKKQAETVGIQSVKLIGRIDVGVEPLLIFDITVTSHVQMARNRVGIQQLIRRIMSNYSCAFMLFHYEDKSMWEWRFTFCYKGGKQEETTDSKRFTFLLGPGQHCRTATENFQKLIDKKEGVEIKDIQDAFSVEALNKEFFDKYREHYADFVEYITGKRYVKSGSKWKEEITQEPHPLLQEQFQGDERRVRDYVKKLLGRIVFLHYLQRKGWLGVPKDRAWGEGDKAFILNLYNNASETQKDDFIEQVLEPLFYHALNKDRTQANDLFDTGVAFKGLGTSLRIPYLNGGLFEEDENDKLKVQFPASYFERVLNFFSQYNFTIDENDPSDAQVGVDPEMLGRIFESLLEDNKEKGAFYTPKEIVQYMCRESLIAYLRTGIEKETLGYHAIAEFVMKNDASLLVQEGCEDLRPMVLDKLKDVKICDPAIGSGAFPMGLLRELYHCRIALEDLSIPPVEIKSQIIKNNIYGVDIEQGAVDIARLRFWLSLVVDEDTPRPLPNLDYKIMQGNSLLESYQGVDLSTLVQRKKINAGDIVADLFEDMTDVHRQQLRNAINRYYDETNHQCKAQLQQEIDDAIASQLAEQNYQIDFTNIKPSANPHFFLWHTWFNDVFNRPTGRNGFDIVIGNPPYVALQNNNGELGNLYAGQGYQTYAKTGDIYCLFYERGWQLLCEGGHLCLITSNKWMRAGYGEKTRDFLAKHTNPELLVDFGGVKIFENATVDVNTLLFSKSDNQHHTIATTMTKQDKERLNDLSHFVQQHHQVCDFSTKDSWVILSAIEQSIKRKIEAVGTPLKDWDINIYRGVLTGCNDAFIIDTAKRREILNNCQSKEERQRTAELIRPILRGRDIKRYGYDWADLWLIATFPACHYDIELYPAVKNYLLDFGRERLEQTGRTYTVDGKVVKSRKKTNNKWFEVQDSISYWEDFDKPKIVWGEISDRSKFAYESGGKFIPEATTFLMVGECLLYLFCALNSPLSEWFFSKVGTTTGVGTVRWKKYTIQQLLLPNITDEQKDVFDNHVEQYIKEKLAMPDFSKRINAEIYKSVGLTDIEIDYVENFYPSLI